MPFEFHFQVDPDRIRVFEPSTGLTREAANRVVYRQKDGKLLSLGEGRASDPVEPGTCTAALFTPEGTLLPYELLLVEHFTRLLHRELQALRPMPHFLAKVVDAFDYLLQVPGYEAFSSPRRDALEGTLQARLRLRRLVINGREVQVPLWKRNLEFWLRRLLLIILPLVAMVIAYLQMPPAFASSPLPFLAFLLVVTYGTYYTGKVAWMLLARLLVPQAYRLGMLQGIRPRLSRLDKFLARLLWGAPLP